MYITIPNPPSPAYIPPDKRWAPKLKTREVKEETLRQFLQDMVNGKTNKPLMWALFLVNDSTPTLTTYFTKLADSLGIEADVVSVEVVVEEEPEVVVETQKVALTTTDQTTGFVVPLVLVLVSLILLTILIF